MGCSHGCSEFAVGERGEPVETVSLQSTLVPEERRKSDARHLRKSCSTSCTRRRGEPPSSSPNYENASMATSAVSSEPRTADSTPSGECLTTFTCWSAGERTGRLPISCAP